MGRSSRFSQMSRLTTGVITFAYMGSLGLGLYEMTAKSPTLLGEALPGWWATVRAEQTTRWNPPTGILPVDKLLHESEEAVRFYRILIQPADSRSPVQPRYPSRSLRSSRSLSKAR